MRMKKDNQDTNLQVDQAEGEVILEEENQIIEGDILALVQMIA